MLHFIGINLILSLCQLTFECHKKKKSVLVNVLLRMNRDILFLDDDMLKENTT